jgi:DNA-directed RNA polymerase sigma subunit (sigma70/sigma32)
MGKLFNMESLNLYLRQCAEVPPLSKSDEAALLLEVARGERASRRLIEAYLPLVVSIADRHLSSGLSKIELYQEGNIGVIRAVANFSGPSEAFAAYVESHIQETIKRAIADAQARTAD